MTPHIMDTDKPGIKTNKQSKIKIPVEFVIKFNRMPHKAPTERAVSKSFFLLNVCNSRPCMKNPIRKAMPIIILSM